MKCLCFVFNMIFYINAPLYKKYVDLKNLLRYIISYNKEKRRRNKWVKIKIFRNLWGYRHFKRL